MSFSLPLQGLFGGRAPNEGPFTMPTAAPTKLSDFTTANGAAYVSENGAVTIDVDKACSVTIYYYNKAANAVRLGSSVTAGHTKAYGAAGIDYFLLPPGVLFMAISDQASTSLYHDGKPL